MIITIFYKEKNLFFFDDSSFGISDFHNEPLSGHPEIPKTEKTVNQDEANRQWIESQEKLYKLTSTEVDLILKEVQYRFLDKTERFKALTSLRLNTPYQFGCLGEEKGRDNDPIFRLDMTDCTAFVLTNAALLHSKNVEEAEEAMRYLNYRPGSEISFESRLHFTTDRNTVSPYFKDATEKFFCDCELETVKIVLNMVKEDGERLIDIDWEREMVIKYLPSKNITKTSFSNLPKAIGIGFVKEGDEKIGLDIRHEGFLFDGEVLSHASSAEKKVVSVNFFEYYFGAPGSVPRFDGIILFEVE